MKESKTIYFNLGDAAGFDAAVKESLREGWTLVRLYELRECAYYDFMPCRVAELEREVAE